MKDFGLKKKLLKCTTVKLAKIFNELKWNDTYQMTITIKKYILNDFYQTTLKNDINKTSIIKWN